MTRRCFSDEARYLPSGCHATDVTIVLELQSNDDGGRASPFYSLLMLFRQDLFTEPVGGIPEEQRPVVGTDTGVEPVG